MKNALGVSIALVAVLWTWLVLAGPLNGIALVWAGFIAWGAYFTVGKQALGKTIAGDYLWIIDGHRRSLYFSFNR